MRSFLTLIQKDLKGYFDQPTGYILLVIFLGVSSFFFFQTALPAGEASLRVLFGTILPWTLAVFIPAATMRLVAEEQRDGTLEILLTQPVRGWGVLFAKYVTGLIFVGIGIALTLGIPLALMTAGDLDDGAVIAQYIGTFFLTAALVAIGLFSSSLTRNQIVAFMVALTLTMALMFAGLPVVSLALPSEAAVLLQGLSPLVHYEIITRGVLDLRDVIYFVSIISVFVSATYLMFRGKTVSHRSPLYLNLQLGVAGLVVLSLLIGWFGGSIRGRLDLTEQRLHTLSPATHELLSNLDDVVTIKFFSSKDPPPQISLATRDVGDFLDDIQSASNGNVKVVRRYPDESDEAEEEARQRLVPPAQFSAQTSGELTIQTGWLGMAMTYANRHEVIQFVDTIDGLEYQVAANIYRMAQKGPRTIGIYNLQGAKRRDAELQPLRDELERHHFVEIIDNDDPGYLDGFLGTLDALIIAGPNEFIDPTIRDEFDDYLARGGKALVLLDPVAIEPGSLFAEPNEFSLADWLLEYGIALNEDVVLDMRSNETVQFRTRFGAVALRYPYWPRVASSDRKVSGGVASVVLPWASSVEIVKPYEKTLDIEVTPLFETTEFGAIDREFTDISTESPKLGEITEEDMGKRLMAVVATGTRCPSLEPRCAKDPDNPFRMIVVADSDWIDFRMTNQYPEHITLGTNLIDWLTQDDALAAIRAKGSSLRELTFTFRTERTHRNLVQYSNMVGVPLIIALLGLVRFFMRRRTMRKVYSREG